MSFDVSVWVSPAIWYSALRSTIHAVRSWMVFSLLHVFGGTPELHRKSTENTFVAALTSLILGFMSFCAGLRTLLLKSKWLKMLFPPAGSLHYIPTLLLFCHAEEPGLRHKTHHMRETGWRSFVFAFMKPPVIILRNFSFAEAEILL